MVGGFENLGGVAAADGYGYWNGAAWATNGAPAVVGGDDLKAIAIDIDDNIYVCGNKDNIGGVTYDNISMWTGSAWVDVGIGLGDVCRALAIGIDGKTLYVGGDFINAGGVANADRVALWTGKQYLSLGSGTDSAVYSLHVANDGDIWATGTFTTAGGSTFNRIAIWNGRTWVRPDLAIEAGTVTVIRTSNYDPAVANNYDVYIGRSTTSSVEIAGAVTVNNPGNADAYPTFILSRSGGTSARLLSIRNETTGKTLHFVHGFTDGDTLTIKLSADGSTVTSSFLGNRRYAFLANSDDGTFVLRPGDNNITCFVDVAGAPTITANSVFKAIFMGYDD